MIQQLSYQQFRLREFSVRISGRPRAKVVANLEVIDEKTGRGGVGQVVPLALLLSVRDQVEEVLVVVRPVGRLQLVRLVLRLWLRVSRLGVRLVLVLVTSL